jgi:Predicted archaeal kinase
MGMDIIKIGGSLITDKSEYRRFLPERAKEIVEILLKIDDLVLVHGGGSFGHFISKNMAFQVNCQRRESKRHQP